MDVITLQRLMGHSTLEITTRYLKFVTNDLSTTHAKFGMIDNLPEHSGISVLSIEHDATRQQRIDQDKEPHLTQRKQSVVKSKEKRPAKRKSTTIKAKKKRPFVPDYDLAGSEGKRPARLNQCNQ